jgi:tetrahydromethanopterin S-methyltransferase subunit B
MTVSTGLHRKRILSAEAAMLPPEAVAKWLEVLKPDDSFSTQPHGTAHEIVLLRRKDPLIDLALAKHGRDRRVLRRVFMRGNSGVRCAALGNRFSPGVWYQNFVHFGFNQLVKYGTKAELSALMQNEFIDVGVLEGLFRREGVFSEIDESRWQLLIEFVAQNPRLEKEYEGLMDGWAEYRHTAYAEDAWKLSCKVPVTDSWADVLESLFRHLPHSFKNDWVEPALERWKDDVDLGDPQLRNKFWLRSRIADQIEDREKCRYSQDLALRMSFYRSFLPDSPSQIQGYFEKDGKDFLSVIFANEHIFTSKDFQETLRKICWNQGSDLTYANVFNSRLEQIKAKNPHLIKDEFESESEELQAIRELREEVEDASEIAPQIDQVIQKINDLDGSVHDLNQKLDELRQEVDQNLGESCGWMARIIQLPLLLILGLLAYKFFGLVVSVVVIICLLGFTLRTAFVLDRERLTSMKAGTRQKRE